jgi:hypothetical protein
MVTEALRAGAAASCFDNWAKIIERQETPHHSGEEGFFHGLGRQFGGWAPAN